MVCYYSSWFYCIWFYLICFVYFILYFNLVYLLNYFYILCGCISFIYFLWKGNLFVKSGAQDLVFLAGSLRHLIYFCMKCAFVLFSCFANFMLVCLCIFNRVCVPFFATVECIKPLNVSKSIESQLKNWKAFHTYIYILIVAMHGVIHFCKYFCIPIYYIFQQHIHKADPFAFFR